MKILITGASGFLGKKAMKIFSEKYEVIATVKVEQEGTIKMDVSNRNEMFKVIEKFKPDILFHTAALVDLDFCEKNKILAWDINLSTPVYLADLCKEKNIKLVVISSDYIFSGNNSPYYEDSVAHPKSFYGFVKMIMEQAVKTINPNAIILRPSIMYGFNNLGGKDKLVVPIVDALKEGKEVAIDDFRPKYPVLIDDIIKNVMMLLEKNERGVFNFASEKAIDRFEMAKIVARVFGLNENLISKVKEKEFKNKPHHVQLINKRMPALKFASFEEGVNVIKSQIEEMK